MSTNGVKFSPSVKEVKLKYVKAMKKVRKFDGLMKQISVWLDTWTQRNFRTEGGKVGGWAPFVHGGRVRKEKGKKAGLAQSITNKAFVDGTAKLLQDSGRLRASFLPFADSKKAGIGSDLPYAEPHQEGGDPWPVKRKIVPEDVDVIKEVMDMANEHADKELKKIRRRR